jgi:hypothetical protein
MTTSIDELGTAGSARPVACRRRRPLGPYRQRSSYMHPAIYACLSTTSLTLFAQTFQFILRSYAARLDATRLL